ncbi:MAG: MFS transporter [Deltaproteobacteria bacterium]|nr:MFS transporter [Deltaproteobacteria bacterium]MBN2671569.1 MFS transporter [Deltaproteobacteria bacterium]
MTEDTSKQDSSQSGKHEIAPEDKVPLKQKIAYGFGSTNELWGNWLFPSMIWPVFNMYLLISPSMVGLVVMVNRLVDAVSDPFFGWLSDNTRSKWGRRRPYILGFAILTALFFPVLFLCPGLGSGWSEMSYVWYMIITSGVLITLASGHNMPYAALGSELTPDYNERTSVFSYKTIIQKLPEIGMFFAAMFIALSIFNNTVPGISQDDVAALNDRISGMRSEANELKKANVEIEEAKAKPADADAKLNDIEARVAKLESSLNDVNVEIAGMEAKVTAAANDETPAPWNLGDTPEAAAKDDKAESKKSALTIRIEALETNLQASSVRNEAMKEKPDMLQGARVYAVFIGIIMIIVGIIVFTVVKERYYHTVAVKQERVKISETLFTALTCKPFRVQLAMAVAIGIGMSMVGTLGYFTTVFFVCEGDWALGAEWNFYMGLANMSFPFVGVPFYAFISKKIGKKKTMGMVMIMATGMFLLTWVLYNPAIKWLQLFAAGGIAFTQAGFWMLYSSMMADVVDWDEMETGKRREGAFNACGSWMMKVGMALGGGAAGLVLESTGFDANLGGAQSVEALTQMRLWLMIIPIIGYIVAFAFLIRLNLTPKVMEGVRKKLEEIRGAV